MKAEYDLSKLKPRKNPYVLTLRWQQMNSFRITIASPPDREKLVAEIFEGTVQVAELNQENGTLEIELYPRIDNRPWRFDAEQFLAAIAKAKTSLLGMGE